MDQHSRIRPSSTAAALFARRPSSRTIERFLAAARDLPLSYSPIGLASGNPAGYAADELVTAIGRGRDDFNRARAALLDWKPFDVGWVQVFPPAAPLEPGTVVAVVAQHLGFCSLNGCRVVYGLDDRNSDHALGFACGTLVNHMVSGEELFEVSLRPDTNEVMFRVRAVSRPGSILAWVGYPFARMLQARFRHDSAAAMKRATSR